jgi:hypothetical protein
LYTESTFYSELQETDVAEMQRANIASVILTLLMLGVSDVVSWDYIERPRMEGIAAGLEGDFPVKRPNSKIALFVLLFCVNIVPDVSPSYHISDLALSVIVGCWRPQNRLIKV